MYYPQSYLTTLRPSIYCYKTTILVALFPCVSSSQVPNQFLLQHWITLIQILFFFSSVYTSYFTSVVKIMQKSRHFPLKLIDIIWG